MAKIKLSQTNYLTKEYVAKYFYPDSSARYGWMKLKYLFGDNPVLHHLFHSSRHYVYMNEFAYMRASF